MTDSDLLRDMVRQVLLELVPQPAGVGVGDADALVVTEVITSDADLQGFARRIAEASEQERAAIVAGTTLYRLAHGGVAAVPEGEPSSVGGGPELVIERGAVTERHVRSAEAAGSRIVLGPKAVLTPLARDRARAAGVEITRER